MRFELPVGAPTGIGSLPFRDPIRAARFVQRHLPELPAIPTLPKRSPAESMVPQAVVGIQGITVGQYGSLAVDLTKVDPAAPVVTPIEHGAFAGLRAFLEVADPSTKSIKWQIVGPLTLGLTLVRAGVPTGPAFEVAIRAIRSHVSAIHQRVDAVLPGVPQLVFIDEPMFTDVQDESFPVPASIAIDYVSMALATVQQFGVSGVHCCGRGDWGSIIASGPEVLSLPVTADLAEHAGLLGRFLEDGGCIAWGAVHTDRPIPSSSQRPWRELMDLWDSLAAGGCDQDLLRHQSMLTPACGLFAHAESVAERVFRILREMSDRLRGIGGSAPLTIGA